MISKGRAIPDSDESAFFGCDAYSNSGQLAFAMPSSS